MTLTASRCAYSKCAEALYKPFEIFKCSLEEDAEVREWKRANVVPFIRKARQRTQQSTRQYH